MSILTKKKSTSLTSSTGSANYTTSSSKCGGCFTKFDEKKDYARRCSMKGSTGKPKPSPVSFCLGKN